MPNITILNKDIETSLHIFSVSIALILIAGFGVYRVFNRELLLSFIDFSLSLFLAYSLIQIFRDTFTYRLKSTLLAVCMIGACAVIYTKGNSSIYWAYPPITGAFFFLKLHRAIVFNLVFIIAVLSILIQNIQLSEFFSIFISLFLICFFGYIFSARAIYQNKQLEILADLDPLTSLKNRRSLQEQLVNEIAFHKKNIHKSSLIILDLDHFKHINDVYGHTVGDNILVQFSKMLKNTIRETDKVYRYGGEEFIIIANNTRLENAGKLAEHLRRATESTLIINNKSITVSIGVAEVSKEDTDISWLHRADHALYKAKHSNRNVVYLAHGNKNHCKYKRFNKKLTSSSSAKRATTFDATLVSEKS